MVVLVKTNVYKNASICSITIVSLVANSRSMFQTVNRKKIQLLYIQSPNSYMTDLLLFGLLKCFLPASSSFIFLLLSMFLFFVSIKDQRNLKNKTNSPQISSIHLFHLKTKCLRAHILLIILSLHQTRELVDFCFPSAHIYT